MSDIAPILLAVATLIGSLVAAYVSIKNARTIRTLEENTNSIKDALVATTRSDALQEGHAAGVADEKAKPTRTRTRKRP